MENKPEITRLGSASSSTKEDRTDVTNMRENELIGIYRGLYIDWEVLFGRMTQVDRVKALKHHLIKTRPVKFFWTASKLPYLLPDTPESEPDVPKEPKTEKPRKLPDFAQEAIDTRTEEMKELYILLNTVVQKEFDLLFYDHDNVPLHKTGNNLLFNIQGAIHTVNANVEAMFNKAGIEYRLWEVQKILLENVSRAISHLLNDCQEGEGTGRAPVPPKEIR